MMDPNLIDFSVIKQKIIKTDEVLQMYMENAKKLKKSQHAYKELKSNYEQTSSSLARIQLENERCTFTLQQITSKYEQLELEYKQLDELKQSLELKYNNHIIDSQSTILELQDELRLMRELNEGAESLSLSPKKKHTSCDSEDLKRIDDLETVIKNLRDDEARYKQENEKLLSEKLLFVEDMKRLKNEHSKDIALLQVEKSKLILDVNELKSQINTRQIHDNEKIQKCDEEIRKLKAEVLILRGFKEQVKNLQKENAKLKIISSKQENSKNTAPPSVRDAQTQTQVHSLPDIESKTKLDSNKIKLTKSCCTQTEDSDDGECVDEMLREMIMVPKILSPMPPIYHNNSKLEPVLEQKIPDIIITPCTPIDDDIFFTDTTKENILCEDEKPPQFKSENAKIVFKDDLGSNESTTKISPPISQPLLDDKKCPRTRRRKHRFAYKFNDLMRFNCATLRQYAILNKQILRKELRGARRSRKHDGVLGALRVLKRNKINFTISSETSNECQCSASNLLEFFNVKREVDSPNRMGESLDRKPADPLNWLSSLSENNKLSGENVLLEQLAELVSEKLKNTCPTPRRRRVSDNSDFASETEPEIEQLFDNPTTCDVLQKNKVLLKTAKNGAVDDKNSTFVDSEAERLMSPLDSSAMLWSLTPPPSQKETNISPQNVIENSKVVFEDEESCDDLMKYPLCPDLLSPLSSTPKKSFQTKKSIAFDSPQKAKEDLIDHISSGLLYPIRKLDELIETEQARLEVEKDDNNCEKNSNESLNKTAGSAELFVSLQRIEIQDLHPPLLCPMTPPFVALSEGQLPETESTKLKNEVCLKSVNLSPSSNCFINDFLSNEREMCKEIDSFVINFDLNQSFAKTESTTKSVVQENKMKTDEILNILGEKEEFVELEMAASCPQSPEPPRTPPPVDVVPPKIIPLERECKQQNTVSIRRSKRLRRSRKFSEVVADDEICGKQLKITHDSIKDRAEPSPPSSPLRYSKRLRKTALKQNSETLKVKHEGGRALKRQSIEETTIIEEKESAKRICQEFLDEIEEPQREAQSVDNFSYKEVSLESTNVIKHRQTNDISVKKLPIKRKQKISKIKSNVLRQMKEKQKMFQTTDKQQAFSIENIPSNNNGVQSSNSLQLEVGANNKIHIVQNILIPAGHKTPVDLLKVSNNSDSKSNNRIEDGQQSRVTKTIENSDILSQILGQMDKGRPTKRLLAKPTTKQHVVAGGIEDKEWRKGILDIAEVTHNNCVEAKAMCDLQIINFNAEMRFGGVLNNNTNLSQKLCILLKKLGDIPDEENIPDHVIMEFKRLSVDIIVDIIILKVAKDVDDKPDTKYYPAPLMTRMQRICLGLMVKLEKDKMENLLDAFLARTRQYIFRIGYRSAVNSIVSLTRLFTGVCRLRADIHRMRLFCWEAFLFTKSLSVPILFAVLTSWIEILPMAVHVKNYPVAKVMVQLVLTRKCTTGHNWLPLKSLLIQFYGYPKERWDCDELFEEMFQEYLKNPSPTSDLAVRLLCGIENRPWVYKKINEYFKPLIYKIPAENVNFKATTILLLGKICQQFRPYRKQDEAYLVELRRWFLGLLENDVPDLVKQSVIFSIDRFPVKKLKGFKKKNDNNESAKVVKTNLKTLKKIPKKKSGKVVARRKGQNVRNKQV